MRERSKYLLLGSALAVFVAFSAGCGDSSTTVSQGDAPSETVAPMRMPSLDALPELPSAAAVAEQADAVSDVLENPRPQPFDGEADAFLLAWAEALEARDQANPPLPQRWTAR